MKKTGLTDSKIQALRAPETGQDEHPDSTVPGLRVRIGKSGAKTFVLRRRVNGKPRNVTLGRYHPIHFSLAAARRKAREIITDIEGGHDPLPALAEAKAAVADNSFANMWERYLASEVRGKKRSASEIERIGKQQLIPVLGARRVESVTRGEVTKLVDAIMHRDPDKPTPRAALSAHQQLSAFYSWCLKRMDALPANPCAGAGRPALGPPRERKLDFEEIKAFWAGTERLGWPYREGFQLLLITAQRRGEVFGMRWSELDLESALWTLPGERVKNGRTHQVPLSPPALAILQQAKAKRQADCDFVFAARGKSDATAQGMAKALRRLRAMDELKGVPNFTLHDLRRTAATQMARLGRRIDHVEAVLNHVSGTRGGLVATYNQYDLLNEARAALNAWALELEQILAGDDARADNVVSING